MTKKQTQEKIKAILSKDLRFNGAKVIIEFSDKKAKHEQKTDKNHHHR